MFQKIRISFRKAQIVILVMCLSLVSVGLNAQSNPDNGEWMTWILESADQLQVDAPPDDAATAEEIAQLISMSESRDEDALAQIAYWDAGPPAYRWNQITMDEIVKRGIPIHFAERALSLVHVAIYDGTVAGWNSKQMYNRPRPSDFDSNLTTTIPNPSSPSYPSEYAITAGAASTVLAWLFPDKADYFEAQAQQAVESRLMAGVEYPSDIEAGLKLGQEVAELVIAYGESDRTNSPWDGTIPTDPTGWTGENPILPQAGTWQTWVLTSGDQFRPEPPPAYGSDELEAEMQELRDIERNRYTITSAFFWEYGSGAIRNHVLWNDMASRLILQSDMADNPLLSAQVYAVLNIAAFDSLVACWDGKYAYWMIRPFQLDPEFTPLFPTPNHPSYPAGHSCVSTSMATALAGMFPVDAERILATAQEASESRLWGGIHYRSDAIAGDTLGQNVAHAVLNHAMSEDS